MIVNVERRNVILVFKQTGKQGVLFSSFMSYDKLLTLQQGIKGFKRNTGLAKRLN